MQNIIKQYPLSCPSDAERANKLIEEILRLRLLRETDREQLAARDREIEEKGRLLGRCEEELDFLVKTRLMLSERQYRGVNKERALELLKELQDHGGE